jgi:SAM-dependent methyltransferase
MTSAEQPSPRLSWEQAVCWLREQPDQQELVRACFFDDPLLGAAERYHASGEWRAVQRFLPPTPGRALDLGAGRGISSYALARDGWSTVALEPDPSAIVGAAAIRGLATSAGLAIEVVEEWGEALPFPAASFDLVHCRQALHHARDLPRLCAEIGRVLKPGGAFIATREHVISRREDLPRFLEQHPLHAMYGGENAYLLTEYVAAINGGGVVLDHVLNPFESEINLFPATIGDVKKQIARRFFLPPSAEHLVPDWMVRWRGARFDMPGRLYSFVGHKPQRDEGRGHAR